MTTTVTRFNPLQQMERMQRDLDRIFGVVADQARTGWLPPVDVEQTDAATVLKMDLPGVPRDAVAIEAHDGTLTISGERSEQKEETHEGYVTRERSIEKFARSFTLPQHAKVDEITASMSDGLLTVTVPRPVAESAKTIEVA